VSAADARALFTRLTREALGVVYTRRRGRWRAEAAGYNAHAGTGATQADALADLLVRLAETVSARAAILRLMVVLTGSRSRKAVRK
jgi:hypothetical protein